MRKLLLLLAIVCGTTGSVSAQGYDIRINMKNCKDTMVYLVRYLWDNQYIADTCKKIKNGQIQFKGKQDLEKGMYVLVSQASTVYFDFFVNDSQKFTINTDGADPANNLSVTGSKDNDLFFTYLKYVASKNREFGELIKKTEGMNREDSMKFMSQKVTAFMAEAKKFDEDYMQKVKGTFVYDFMNLKTEKEAKSVPNAKNKQDSSIYQYYYYKSHYFDGIDFKDERIVRTPIFDDRVKKYFEQVILQHPDTVIAEIDKILSKSEPGNDIHNMLVGYFTYKYEQSKIMGFDKVFVHLADKYILTGKASEVYTAETVAKIKERVDIMRNLLLEAKVAELYMIDTIYGKQVRKMGFDTASSSESLTYLYQKNEEKLAPLFKRLYQVNAKYTILVFWAADCGHCQTEVPKLHEELTKLKGQIDFKVFAVQTKDELFDTWRKFIIEKKMTDFIHVFDPVHLNNLKERFDIYSTPVIYILDKDKKIKAKRLAAEQVPEMLKTLESLEEMQKKQG